MFRSQAIVDTLLKFREWEKINLPSPKSILCYELFLLIVSNTLNTTPLTLYQLFLTVGYTQKAIQFQLNKLIKAEFCELVLDSKDKRFKKIIATKKMLDLAEQYSEIVSEVLISKLQTNLKIFKKI